MTTAVALTGITFNDEFIRPIILGIKTHTRRVIKITPSTQLDEELLGEGSIPCPYGKPGDTVFVKEAWYQVLKKNNGPVWYRADWIGGNTPWKSARSMPRWASRIILEITNVRVQRIQDITCDEIKLEGIRCPRHDVHIGTHPWDNWRCVAECRSLRAAFYDSWEKIYPGSINRNDWVWVIEFMRVI